MQKFSYISKLEYSLESIFPVDHRVREALSKVEEGLARWATLLSSCHYHSTDQKLGYFLTND